MNPPTTSVVPPALAPALDVGLLLFRPDGALSFADSRAQALFGCKDVREVEQRLNGVRSGLTPQAPPRGQVEVQTTVGGRPRKLRLDLARMGEKGGEGFLGIVTDGDVMGALETDLRFATHLRAMSLVAVATAHDIRTPLHTIVLYLELLRNTLAERPEGNPAERQERYVEVIGSELQRLEAIMEGLLSQIRVDEERADRFDLHETVNELRSFLEPHCRKTRVEIRLEPAASPVVVEANKDSVRHALVHILVTSVEERSGEGAVDVSVSASDGVAVVSITGNLSGLSPAILSGEPKAEDAFGVERGLFAARRVVERLGGGIKLRSGAHGASTLEISLPLAAAEQG